jgi:uncharacterized protein YbjT (DUF2867 family)
MPVIIIGADTEYGPAVASALSRRQGEVRAFVTDPATAEPLRALGIKVAVGDVSDASHIEGAAHDAFSAVLMAEAALDGRERSFAASYEKVVDAWKQGLADAGVKRLIWIGPDAMPSTLATWIESASIDAGAMTPDEAGSEAARLDDLAAIEES